MKILTYKIISLLLTLSVILPMLTLIPFAKTGSAENGEADAPAVYFNRGFEDGWDYSNGFSTEHKGELNVHLSYTKLSPSRYNYYMNISPSGDMGGYLKLSLGENAPDTGHIFFELDLKSYTVDNNIGGIIMVSDSSGYGMSHIVSFRDGEMYLLGENAGTVPSIFTELAFDIDIDYEDESTQGDDYRISVTYDGVKYERVYTASSGKGIDAVYIGAQENFFGTDREGDLYAVDNVRLYSGVDERAELSDKNYGVLVNLLAERDFPIEGAGGGAYLSGQPDIERVHEGAENVTVHYNRHFAEGWNFDNGFTSDSVMHTLRGNGFELATDYSSEVGKGALGFLNYYFRFVQKNQENGFACIDTSQIAPRTGKTYLEFDIKASVGANISCVMSFLTQGNPYLEFTAINLVDGDLVIFGKNFGSLGEEWCHVIIEMDLDYGPSSGDPTAIKYTATVGEKMDSVTLMKYLNPTTADVSSFRGLRQIRIGKAWGLKEGTEGDWFGLDNLQVYSSPDGPATLALDNYGSLVNETNTKDFPINQGTTSEMSVAEIVEASIVMKVGSANALILGKRAPLLETEDGTRYGAPYVENGVVMVPLEPILKYAGVPYRFNSSGLGCDIFSDGEYRSVAVGRGYIQVGGETLLLSALPVMKNFDGNQVFYVGLDDVETIFHGCYVTYDEVGFISIGPVGDYINRDADEPFMQNLMESFLYDDVDKDKLYDMAKEYTNNFEHPYFFANGERFEYLYDVYHSDVTDEIYDEDLVRYIDDAVKNADSYLAKWADLDADGNYLQPKLGRWCYNSQGMASWVTYDKTPSSSVTPENADNHSVSIAPYPDSAGYDPAGGRLNVLSDGTGALVAAFEPMGFAYLVTGEEKYARFAYDWAIELCKWPHWGPAHYLNVAESARDIAMAYDMLYNAWVAMGLDPTPIRDGLSRHCTYTAWLSTTGRPQEYLRADGSESGDYWSHIGNWNPVCSAAVIAACLISFEDETDIDLREKAAFALERTIYYLGQNGFTYFTFDGGYRESSGYWCATIRFSQFCIETLRNAFGHDFGLSNAPGLDTSNYFGSHCESNEFVSWNYHDDWVREMPSFWYYMAAEMFDNPEFAAIRYQQIAAGKPTNYLDAVFYDKEMIEKGQVNLALDLVMTSIDGTMSRASWEPGALYVGMLGGVNNVAHGQYDSGNWIYENAGIRWFCDLGADDYNLYGGGLTKGYYRYSAEGNNTVAISSIDSLPHGQVLASGGVLTSAITNQYGSATIIDQSPAYGGSANVSYARRGMLLTNDRKTVVIQDEINLVLIQDLYWFAHYDTNVIKTVTLSDDGKTAYMTSYPDKNGETHTLRVSLITANRGFKFEIWDTYKYVLDTPGPDYSASFGKPSEGNRNNFRKLVISGNGVLKFEIAVVIELIDDDPNMELGYKLGWDGQKNQLRPMSTWVPEPDYRDAGQGGGDAVPAPDYRPVPSIYEMIFASKDITELLGNDPLGEKRESFFKLLSSVEYCLRRYGREFDDEEILDAIFVYDKARKIYDNYYSPINDAMGDVESIMQSLVGIG